MIMLHSLKSAKINTEHTNVQHVQIITNNGNL